MPSNTTPHPDARKAPDVVDAPSARAGGRERWASEDVPWMRERLEAIINAVPETAAALP